MLCLWQTRFRILNSVAVNDELQLKPELKFHHNSKTQLNEPLLFFLFFLSESVRDKAIFFFNQNHDFCAKINQTWDLLKDPKEYSCLMWRSVSLYFRQTSIMSEGELREELPHKG